MDYGFVKGLFARALRSLPSGSSAEPGRPDSDLKETETKSPDLAVHNVANKESTAT